MPIHPSAECADWHFREARCDQFFAHSQYGAGIAQLLAVGFRLTGQAIATFVEDAGYRDSMRDTPEMNRWQAISRLAVERDDDIPLTALCRMGLNQLRTRHTAKAYTFLQFLREEDGPSIG